MKFCANCGQRMPDEDMFCSNCGARFPKTPVQTGISSVPVVASRTQPIHVAKPIDVAKPKPAAVNSPTPSGDLAVARKILFSTFSVPDYGKALAYIERAKKMGASAVEIQYLNLATQLYRTLDMLRVSYQMSGGDGKQVNIFGNPVPASGSVSSAPSLENQEKHSKTDGKASTGDLLKSAAIGAVTGAVAQAITKSVLDQNNRSVTYRKGRAVDDGNTPVTYYEEDPTLGDDSEEYLTDGGLEELSAIPTVAAAEPPADGYGGMTDTDGFASSNTLLGNQDSLDDTIDDVNDDSAADDLTVDTDDDDDFDFDSDDSSIFDDLF